MNSLAPCTEREVRLGVVRHLMAHAGLEREPAPVFPLHLAYIARRVLHHAHANAAKVLRLPERLARFGLVLRSSAWE